MKLSSLITEGASNPEFLWRNGEIVRWADSTVHVTSVGHATVSSVFEGIKAYWNADEEQLYVFRLREHMKRMIDSLKIVRLGASYSQDEMAEGVLAVLRANQTRRDTYIRPWVFARGLVREQMVPIDAPTEMVIDTWPFSSKMLTERGCRAGVSSWTRIGDNSMPPRAKVFSNYHNGRLGIMEATVKGFDWPIFLNERFKVTEGPGSCVALVRDGTVISPSLSSGVLESITRATFLVLLPELGVPFVEREVDRTELYVADEMFFMGTGWEVLPILEIDGSRIGDGKMGPITKQLDRAYHDVVRGATTAHAQWRTPVWASEAGGGRSTRRDRSALERVG